MNFPSQFKPRGFSLLFSDIILKFVLLFFYTHFRKSNEIDILEKDVLYSDYFIRFYRCYCKTYIYLFFIFIREKLQGKILKIYLVPPDELMYLATRLYVSSSEFETSLL